MRSTRPRRLPAARPRGCRASVPGSAGPRPWRRAWCCIPASRRCWRRGRRRPGSPRQCRWGRGDAAGRGGYHHSMPAAPAAPTVLQVLPALVSGGVGRGPRECAEGVVRAGGRALVASAGGPLVAPLEALGARHVTLPLATKNPLGILRNAGRLAAVIRAEGVGIIHARSRAPAWSALLAARRTAAHFVTTYHGTYNENFPGKRWYNSVMARGERVIAISNFIAGHIREHHRTEPCRIRVIPRGVDTALFDPALVAPARLQALRAAWGLPE